MENAYERTNIQDHPLDTSGGFSLVEANPIFEAVYRGTRHAPLHSE
jgi:hypothetical protein